MDPRLQPVITRFFRDPNLAPDLSEAQSVLYLLRRDIQGCLAESRYLFPATMAILAGIDLLAKFHAGEAGPGGVGARFRAFVNAYFAPIATGDAEAIYALRNALLHSFGLYSEGHYFYLVENLGMVGSVVNRTPDGAYVIGIRALFQHFDAAIARYQTAVTSDPERLQAFLRIVTHYGFIEVGVPRT